MLTFTKKVRAVFKVLAGRTFAVVALSVVMASIVLTVSASTNAVFIRDEEDTTLKFTFHQDVKSVLGQSDIVTLSSDIVQTLGFQGNYAEVNITRSFPVAVTADGVTREVMATPQQTVRQLLDKLHLEFDSNDVISLPLPKPLEEGDHVILQRIDYVSRTVSQSIPYETITKENSLLTPGRTKVLVAGQEGKKILTYIDRTIDGVVQEEELVGEDIVAIPVNKQVLVGAKKAVSPLNFGTPLDSNGKPVSYQRVIQNVAATGYNAGRGAWGASGMDLSAGYVAVNPKEIPYGTKMYITSADNRFIYGYAIAADTGTALMQGKIGVDLYYDTYAESCLNGRKTVNIYVLN